MRTSSSKSSISLLAFLLVVFGFVTYAVLYAVQNLDVGVCKPGETAVRDPYTRRITQCLERIEIK